VGAFGFVVAERQEFDSVDWEDLDVRIGTIVYVVVLDGRGVRLMSHSMARAFFSFRRMAVLICRGSGPLEH
jgi:hypothetical protein